jgi:putative redox protein
MSTVVVRGSGLGLRQDIVASGHQMVADEPVEAGGTDAGPNPYEFLLAALGS